LLSSLAAFVIYHFSLFTLHFSFILLPSPFGEGLGVRLSLSPLRGAGGVLGLG